MKRAFTLLEILCLLAIAVILAVVFYPVFHRPPRPSRSPCQSNLKQLGLGIKQYIQDYDEKYPIVISGGEAYGWADAIQPYIKSVQIYQCPGEANGAQAIASSRAIGYTDYWLNARLAGREEKSFTGISNTILLGDGHDNTDATDARYALNSIPAAWIGNKSSPIYRHLGGPNLAFADGHVKWFSAEKVETMDPDAPPKPSNLTFAVK